jgi:hypothetical protein
MSATELSPQGPGTDAKIVPVRNDEGGKKARMASMARASTDGVLAGWLVSLSLYFFRLPLSGS